MNSVQESQAIVSAVIQKVMGVREDIHMEMRLAEVVEADFVEVLVMLEDIYEIHISDERAAGFRTVGDLVKHIENLAEEEEEDEEEEDTEGSKGAKRTLGFLVVLIFIGAVIYATTSNGAIVFT